MKTKTDLIFVQYVRGLGIFVFGTVCPLDFAVNIVGFPNPSGLSKIE